MTNRPPKRHQLLGDKIAALRSQRRLSRAKLVSKALGLLTPDDQLRGFISESSLREIEEGNRAYLSRQLLELICAALECSASERFDVLLAADRNVFAERDGNTSEPLLAVLRALQLLLETDPVVKTQIEVLLDQRDATRLNAEELISILERVISMAAARMRREKFAGTPSTLQPPIV
jgi:transcriptional regulator with XRE-family HTH domain